MGIAMIIAKSICVATAVGVAKSICVTLLCPFVWSLVWMDVMMAGGYFLWPRVRLLAVQRVMRQA